MGLNLSLDVAFYRINILHLLPIDGDTHSIYICLYVKNTFPLCRLNCIFRCVRDPRCRTYVVMYVRNPVS